jgi:hypothetical protein
MKLFVLWYTFRWLQSRYRIHCNTPQKKKKLSSQVTTVLDGWRFLQTWRCSQQVSYRWYQSTRLTTEHLRNTVSHLITSYLQNDEYCLLGYKAVQSFGSQPTFRRNILLKQVETRAIFLRNVGWILTGYAALYPRILYLSWSCCENLKFYIVSFKSTFPRSWKRMLYVHFWPDILGWNEFL